MEPTEFNMQSAFYSHTYQRYELLAPNVYPTWTSKEMDLFGLRKSGYIDEIEIKCSRADFLADFRKTIWLKSDYVCIISENNEHSGHYETTKHTAIASGKARANYFSFLMPEGLEGKCEIPEYAGLYVFYVDNAGHGRIREIKKAPLMHKRKISDRMKYEI